MQANKNPQFEIKENESHLYHIRATVKLHNEKTKTYEEQHHIICLSPREFRQHKEFSHVLGFDSEEIIHDPTLKTSGAKGDNADATETSQKETTPPVKATTRSKVKK